MKKLALIMFVSITMILVSTPSHSFFGNRGKLKPNKEVTRSFEKGEIIPNHRYFLSGSMSRPTAIIALSSEVELDTTFWVEVEMETKALKFLTEHMKAFTAGDDPYGSKILDKKRNVIGYWYAPPRSTIIKFGKKGVNIYPPEVSGDYHSGGN